MEQRIYIVGAGNIGRHHAALAFRWQEEGEARCFVADPDPASRARLRDAFPGIQTFAGVEEMLSAPAQKDDIVVVATPPSSHFPLVSQALAGGRHVLCEKPLTLSATEARRLLDLARERDRLVGCCSMRFTGLPPAGEVRRLVETADLGPLYHLEFVNRVQRNRSGLEYQPSTPWMLDRREAGGGVLMDWGVYDLAMINHVLSPLEVEVLDAWESSPATALPETLTTPFDVEEHVGATLLYRCASGDTVHVTYERAACTHGAPRRTAELEGARAAVAWDWNDAVTPGNVTRTTDLEGAPRSRIQELGWGSRLPASQRPLHWFRARLGGGAPWAIVNEQAAFNFSCVQAVYEGARLGRSVRVRMEDFA